MNSFGHAVVAGWIQADAPLALGSMLPDFAGMLGARLGEVTHEGLARGVSLHHRTDEAVHDAGAFRGWCRELAAELVEAGVRKGSARAAAHVAVELALDAVLSRDESGRRLYVDALIAGTPELLARHVRWRCEHPSPAWPRLRARLLEVGPPGRELDPERAARRVGRALAHRPRLAMGPGEQLALRVVLQGKEPELAQRAEDVLRAVARELGLARRPVS